MHLKKSVNFHFKIRYVCTISKEYVDGTDLTQLAVIKLCADSTGCDKVDDYFATEADTMIDDDLK